MWNAQQLGWVAHNRRMKSRAELICAPAGRALSRLAHLKGVADNPVAVAVSKVVDQDFMDQCTLGPINSGVLTIFVRDERLICSYRLGWTLDLLEAFQESCPRCRVRAVRFVKAVASQGFDNRGKVQAAPGR